MKVVAAPNPFKGTLGSPAAARAIARGVRRAWPDAEVAEVPVADGGEGTVEALVAAARGELVEVAVDVTNPLTGPEGATAVDGPQKGATEVMIGELDAALAHFAEVVKRDLGQDIAALPGAGAAGGAGAGFVAFLNARLVRGAS